MNEIISNPNAPINPDNDPSQAPQHVINVTTDQFEKEVMERSQTQFVVVDFWSPRSEQCVSLNKTLETLASEYDGTLSVALVNTDEEQMLAQQIGVQSLPTVVLIKDGGLVDQFMGALPEAEVRAFLEKHVGPSGGNQTDLPDGDALFAEGNYGEAAMAYQQRLEANDADIDALLGLADSYLQLDEPEAAKTIVDNLPAEHKNHDRAQAVRAKMEFASLLKGADDQATLEARFEKDKTDLSAANLLGIRYLLSGKDEAALQTFLEMMKLDPTYQDGLPKQRLLQALNMVQDRSLVSKYRGKMANLILV